MLKRRYRLRDDDRFRQVRQTGTSLVDRLMVLCVLPNQQAISRCGVVTSRRIGKAVLRNRARRRIGEVVRSLWDVIEPGWDMVWIARPGVNEAEYSELQDACARLLRRAQLLRTTSNTNAGVEQTS